MATKRAHREESRRRAPEDHQETGPEPTVPTAALAGRVRRRRAPRSSRRRVVHALPARTDRRPLDCRAPVLAHCRGRGTADGQDLAARAPSSASRDSWCRCGRDRHGRRRDHRARRRRDPGDRRRRVVRRLQRACSQPAPRSCPQRVVHHSLRALSGLCRRVCRDLRAFEFGAVVGLVLIVSAYEIGDFLVGSGASNPFEGPIAGVVPRSW